MPKKQYNVEEISHKLREADVLLAQGKAITLILHHDQYSDNLHPVTNTSAATALRFYSQPSRQ